MPEAESVPLSLFHTGRAQCPDCGAALKLLDRGALVTCEYCGGTSVVQRRLRTIEPTISEGFVTADAPVGMARKERPSQVIGEIARDESHCPTCGVELDGSLTQAIRKCAHCGTESKIERRLLRSPDADAALAAMENGARDYDRKQFDATEALIEIVEKSPDLAVRVRAGWELGEMWCHANARAARLLPRVLEVLRTCDPRLEIYLAELVGKLLCNDNAVLANAVLRAAEKFVFDVNGSQALLRQLSLGSGTGLKLLLDAADYSGTRGATDYACSALWGVSTMIERNYPGRMRLAEIVLYRLLYLKGPVQAWAIELAAGQMGLGCRFDMQTLLRFMDDCAAEKPELVKYVRDWFYHGTAANEAEYLARMEFVKELRSPSARATGLEHLYAPPGAMSETVARECLRRLLAMAADPDIGLGAVRAMVDWIEAEGDIRPGIEEMVREVREDLPEEVRRAYLRRFPKSPLLKAVPVKDWSPEKAVLTPFDEQLKEWKKMWDVGIRAVVERQHERQRVAREYFEEVRAKPARVVKQEEKEEDFR